MKKKGISHFIDRINEILIEKSSNFLSSPKLLLFILASIVLIFLFDFSGSETWANAVEGVKERLPFTVTKKDNNPNLDCYIDGQKYKVSEEVCDDIRKNANLDQEADIKTPTPTKQIQKVVNYPTSTPDPIISCNVHANCGGGTRSLRRSICEQSICCQVGGVWLFYENDSKCIEDQNNRLYSNNNSNPYNGNYESVKIPCASNDERFPYNFGELTYTECKIKTDQYWADRKAELGPLPEADHLQKAIQELYDIGHPTYPPIVVPTIDGRIYFDPTPTIGVPYGFSNFPY